MSCYDAGDTVEILAKGTSTVLGEIRISTKTCPQMFARLVLFRMNLERGTYSQRLKRK